VTASAADSQVDESALGELRASFRGELDRPGDPTYDEHRKVWNGSIDRFPTLIARCRGVADVIGAVRFAQGTHLPVALRGGGHRYPGHSTCDGGIVIDSGPMKGIRVDTQARTARVQASVLWGELDRETQAFGLATTGGLSGHTGVAGLTLGGRIGWLHRKHGLTIDQLLSVDLVTAEGELLKASQTENPDLFSTFLGTNEIGLDIHGFDPAGPAGNLNAVRHFDMPSDLRHEIIDARLWAGLHYRFSGVAGVVLGRNVANYDLRHAFRPVD
jgi:hypothetical protein